MHFMRFMRLNLMRFLELVCVKRPWIGYGIFFGLPLALITYAVFRIIYAFFN